jgi:hypothetical protein
MTLLIGTAAGMFSLDHPTSPLIVDTKINNIARDAEGWWAVDDEARIHHNGQIVANGPKGVTLNCVLPVDETIWVGASRARLYRIEGGDVIEDAGFADAPVRTDWYTPWGGPPDVRSMAVDGAGTLFVNVHVGGILRYDDTGPTPTLDQEADVHQVIADSAVEGRVLAACARGLAQSSDGRVFSYRDDGLHAPYCRAVALIGDMVLISASTGPRSNRARLYRSDLTIEPFEECRHGLPEWFDDNLDSHCLAVLDGSVYAGHGGTVWRSDDNGGHWAEVISGLPRITSLA